MVAFKVKKPGDGPAVLAGNAPAVPTDEKRIRRLGLTVLALGLGSFLAWAAFAPLDEGVPAPATVSVDTQRKAVQHLSGGIVSKVLVREAQTVKAGDVLMQLDDSVIRANYEAARKQYLSLRGQEARLVAERTGAGAIRFHPDLLAAAKEDPVARSFIAIEEQLFRTRQATAAGEASMITESIGALEEDQKGVEAQISAKKAQLKLVQDQLVGTRELARDGYLPRNKLNEEERLAAELGAAVSDLAARYARQARNIGELRLKIAQRRHEYQKEVEDKLADVKRDVEPALEKYRATTTELERTLIRAPVSGNVVGLQTQTVGGVIQAGQRIMDIVPADEKLILEVQVPPQYVDRVRAGLPADIRFQGFVDLPYLVLEGTVISVSADRLVDPATHLPYFLSRVEVGAEAIRKLGAHRIQAGMGAEVVIKTGERSFLSYLLKPLVRRVSSSLIEQ